MSAPFLILDIGRRINSLSVAYCDLDERRDSIASFGGLRGRDLRVGKRG